MMKSKVCARLLIIFLAFTAVVTVFTAINVPTINTVYADNLEDSVGSNSNGNTSSNSNEKDILDGIRNQELDENDQGVADWLGEQRGVTSEQLETASETMSPITTIIGYITGGILILTVVGVVCITALDLLYIAVPPVRNILYKAGTDGTGGYTGGYGAGGYGRSMGGYGMGAMGAGGAAGGTKKPTQWVSDEAVACAALLGGSAQAQGGAMGMGAMGGYGMGAMGAAGQPQQAQTTKSVIGMYFKKRIFFILLLALCVIVLTSSALMDCGVNLAEWFLKILNMINGKMEA